MPVKSNVADIVGLLLIPNNVWATYPAIKCTAVTWPGDQSQLCYPKPVDSMSLVALFVLSLLFSFSQQHATLVNLAQQLFMSAMYAALAESQVRLWHQFRFPWHRRSHYMALLYSCIPAPSSASVAALLHVTMHCRGAFVFDPSTLHAHVRTLPLSIVLLL